MSTLGDALAEFLFEDAFKVEDRPATAADRSHSVFHDAKKGARLTVGEKDFIVVRDLGGRTKLLGAPDYFDVNDPVLFFAEEEPYGEITVSRSAKRGDYRPTGKPVARGQARA